MATRRTRTATTPTPTSTRAPRRFRAIEEELAQPWRRSLLAKAENACRMNQNGKAAGSVLEALLHEAEAQEGKKAAPDVVETLRQVIPTLLE